MTCDNCQGDGFYEEGEESTPCTECEVGQRIGEHVDAARKEAQAQVLKRVVGDLVDGYVADPSDLCPPIVETLDAIKAELQAQVLAGVRGALALVPHNAQEDIAQGVNPDVAIEDAIDAVLAALNPSEGEGQ